MNTSKSPIEGHSSSHVQTTSSTPRLEDNASIPETQDDLFTFSSMLHRYEKDAGHWIQESPAESAIRIRGLRKITFALFALGICLTCLLNSRLLLQGVNLQQLIVCNLGIMMVFVLAGIFLLHDVTVKKKSGLSREVFGVRRRLKVVVGQIDELDALRFKMQREHQELVANRKDLSDELIAIAVERNLESEKTAREKESFAAAQAELSKTTAAVADESLKLDRLQQAITTLEGEMEAKLLELELLVAENSPFESNHALAITQEEYANLAEELAVRQAALQAAQEMHFKLLIEIELLESEKAATLSSLTSSKLELVCVELECARIQSVSAETPLLIRASVELEQLNSTIAATEQRIAELAQHTADMEQRNADMEQRNADMEQRNADMEGDIAELEQERSMLQRNIEYSNALEAVASNRSATLNQQVAKLQSDQLELSEALERLVGAIEENSRIRDGLANQNMSATVSLESLLDSVEQLSRKEADLLSACSSAEQKMGDWTTSVESLVTRVDELTSQIATFEEQRVQAIEALENILEGIDLKSADQAAIVDSIESATQKISDLDAVAEAAKTRLKFTESAMQETESVLQDTRNQVGTYESLLSQASENCIAQQAELARVQNDLLTEQRLLAQLQSEIALKAEDKIAVESDLVSLEKLKTKTQIACDDANAELERFVQQLDAMSGELVEKEEQSRRLNTRLGQLRELDDELNLKHQKLDELDKQQLQFEQSFEDAREHLSQLQADSHTVQVELDRLRLTESELTLKSKKMRSENEQLEASYESSNHRLHTLQHELSTFQVKSSQLESEIQASEQRKLEIQRAIDDFANEADEAQAVCKQWAEYGAKLRSDNKEVESEIARLRLECNELRAEQDRSLQEKQVVAAGLSTLKGQRDTLNTEIANREDFLLELKEEQKQVVKQIAANNKFLEQTQADLDRVSSECNSAKSELDSIHSQRRFEGSCVQELAVQQKQLQSEVHGLTQVVEQLRAETEQRELALGTLENNRELIEECIREGNAQQLELANRLSATQRGLAIASDSVAAAMAEKKKHIEGILSLEGEADNYRCQIDSLKKQLTSIELELSANRENATQLSAKLEETRDDCQQAAQLLLENQSKAKEIDLSIEEMRKERSETEQSIRGKQMQSESLDLELSEKSATLESIKRSLMDAEDETAEAQKQLAEVHASIESLRSQAVAAKSDLASLSERKAVADLSIEAAESRSKGLQNLLDALEGEKTSFMQLLDTEKASLDTALQKRVQLESVNRGLADANNSMHLAIRGLQSQRDELAKIVSELDNEIGTNKVCSSQLQLQIEASSAQIAKLEQSQREWMDKESTTIDQVARIRAELKNLERLQSLAKLESEAIAVPTQPNSTWVLDRRRIKLQARSSEAPPATTVELAEEILQEISALATFNNNIISPSEEKNESNLVDKAQSEPSEDPWSFVLG